MYVAKLSGHLIVEGTEIEIPGHPTLEFKFRVISIGSNYFRIVWLTGENAGEKSMLPFSLFDAVDLPVEVIEMKEDSRDPNEAFLIKKFRELL